jgi:hypothetical protein
VLVIELALVLTGAAFIALGWYWGGVTEARTSWVAIGLPGLLLAGITIFKDDALPVWAFTAAGAVGAGLAAAVVGWGKVSDKTLGFYALFYTAAAGLSTGGIAKASDTGFDIHALGTLLAAIGGALVFISAVAMPTKAFRIVVGWLIVLGGLGIAFLGYGPSIGVDF